jgi:hypothetical protein
VSFFWLNYRYPHGRFAGVVVLKSSALISARMMAAVYGLDEGLEFASGHELDQTSADQIPEDMISRFLDDRSLRRLQRMLLTKKSPGWHGR